MKTAAQTSWSLVALIVFLLINCAGIYLIINLGLFDRLHVDGLTFFILALGTWRMTDVIVYEKVTAPVRAIFVDGAEGEGIGRAGKKTGLRAFIGQLISCNSCSGVWAAMVVCYDYAFFPGATFVVMLVMALTGMERFFSKAYDFLEKSKGR